MVKVKVLYKASSLVYDVSAETTVGQLKGLIEKEKKLPVIQQQLFLKKEDKEKKTVLADSELLVDHQPLTGSDGIVINLKNLGRQVEYQNLFYLEYLLPLITFPICLAVFHERINSYYLLITALTIVHFGKRELETKFVHIFSNASVPWTNAWRNLFHYWLLFGIAVPVEIYLFREMELSYSVPVIALLSTLFLLFELLNLYCHYQLRLLRFETVNGKTVMTKKRKVPRGLFFNSIMCPNYTFEILSWIVFTVLFLSYTAVVFTVFGATIMYMWAVKKKSIMLKSDKFTDEGPSNWPKS